MSLYEASSNYIERELSKVHAVDRPARRLEIDLTCMLTGPTCGTEARRIIDGLLTTNTPEEVAAVLRDIADRFFRAQNA